MSRKKVQFFSTFDFSTLYITIPFKPLIKVLSEVINFVFKFIVRKGIGFSKISIYWISKRCSIGYSRAYICIYVCVYMCVNIFSRE